MATALPPEDGVTGTYTYSLYFVGEVVATTSPFAILSSILLDDAGSVCSYRGWTAESNA